MAPSGAAGYLAFLLHAHLPFIPCEGEEISLEEKWLFEALTESYLPLLMSWEKLDARGLDFKLTLSLSPTLMSMLLNPLIQERYVRYLDKLLELAAREERRTVGEPAFRNLALFYQQRLVEIKRAYCDTYRGNLLAPLKRLEEKGHLELITTCATHGYLPLMITPEARYAQIKIALDYFAQVMGKIPEGFWLPECGYTPGLEDLLHAAGVKYVVLATHGFLGASPQPPFAVYAPVLLNGKVAAFGRDWETSHQVWNRLTGYPGDPHYREFYRDIGYDLELDYLQPFLVGGVRGDTGFKYYRITGKGAEKEPYDFEAACGRAKEHARDFVANRRRQIAHWSALMEEPPVVVAPYDAELFGHWWFEGPYWLENVLELACGPGQNFRLTTLGAYLQRHPPRREAVTGFSSWGDGGYHKVWLNPANDWLYQGLHQAEKAMQAMAEGGARGGSLEERLIKQAARELLLAQSSDWAFILTNQTVVEYAARRAREHLQNFFRLFDCYRRGVPDAELLARLEAKHGLFPSLDYRHYCRPGYPAAFCPREEDGLLVCMLAWEYPPHHVGGLGVHVRDLSRALARCGAQVHVLTLSPEGRFTWEVREGVFVHYLPRRYPPGGDSFLYWVLQFNLEMADLGKEILTRLAPRRAILHAHDWLVAQAAWELKEALGMPLVATIHATEYGRHRGLHNELQRTIHRIEGELVKSARKVICCSRYMAAEVSRLFGPPAGAIEVIPNAVQPIEISHHAGEDSCTVLYVGRLVPEKGVQVLLRAFARLVKAYPASTLVVAGTGPYEDELKELAGRLGVADRVTFTGFVSEEARNRLLARSAVAVFPSLYEPFGIVALEAMSAGVPVVVSRAGGLAEIVEHGVTGLTFAPGDDEDLYRCLEQLFSQPHLRSELKRRAREKVAREYTWEAVARKTLAAYREVLKGGNG
ncbi:1,4-alpha-glucan branching protein domain-containing protein [Desulfovirgula thermocuniculi]|uniref:1,4-alpha-glucan branching protein domain-containing protein n=1 Tax=Desulfovirgula thermocuniculi TaxID=348842 RepID=UPI0004067946|nr:1,4-alpha-glucan branching protein domain-containing protein [Desulfovirgula thermocuniculi]